MAVHIRTRSKPDAHGVPARKHMTHTNPVGLVGTSTGVYDEGLESVRTRGYG
jgi:hypothetical protein